MPRVAARATSPTGWRGATATLRRFDAGGLPDRRYDPPPDTMPSTPSAKLLRSSLLLLLPALLPAQEVEAKPAPAPAAPPAAPAPEPPAAMQTIVKQDLLQNAEWLAADERGGRLTGSLGQEAAAVYIADHFKELGLEPLGDEVDGRRGFLQWYGISRTTVLPKTRLRFGERSLAEGFTILGGRPLDTEIRGKLRFCGLGRTRGTSADIGEAETLEGRIAVAVIKPPRGRLQRTLTVEQKFGMSLGTMGQLGRTALNLEKKHAAATLFILLDDPMGLSDVLNYVALSPGKDLLSPRFPGADETMGGLSSALAPNSEAPVIVLSLGASERLLAGLGIERDALAAYVAGEGPRPEGKDDVDAVLTLGVEHDETAKASNVVAVLRGSDPQLAGEAVVFSAHMDHVGRRMDGEVFNGADDNASGSAGLMAIAAAFAKSEQKPRRSVVFLSVSGEELGLWGSAYFAENPTFGGTIVANVNTDMIGRSGPESGPDEVAVTPSHRHSMFSTIVQDAAGFAGHLGLSFTSGDKYYTRSDHFNFAKKGIPVVFFCDGEHEDYHQVTDHADKLDGNKMERIARLAFWTGWAVANADESPRTLGRRESWR